MSSTRRAICAARSADSRTRARPGARAASVAASRASPSPSSAAASDSPTRSSPAATGSAPASAPVALASSSASAPSAARRRSSATTICPRRDASASARTVRRSCAARTAVSRPQASVRSLSRSASSDSIAAAALGHDAELRVELGARLADLGRVRLGRRDLVVVPVQLGRQQARPQLGGLALEAGVDVGGLGLALERAQRLARLALDVERPVEVVLGALELELGAPAALAVLAEPGRLLDEQAAVAGRREHDLLHPALADHRVHLAPEVRVGEDLDHVREPRASAVDAVRALPPRSSRRVIEISENSALSESSASRTTSTSA